MRWTVPKLYIEEAMMSNTRAATTAAAKPLEFQVMSGSFALVGNQPANYTLATGETEALLVDVPFSRSDAHRVVAAILDSGKKLTTIFVTHDHPDHFFSLDLLIESFPNAQIVAHAVVAKDMERSIAPRSGTRIHAPSSPVTSCTTAPLFSWASIWHPNTRNGSPASIIWSRLTPFA
jgi:glyoxylase-like metal-dependent hydrolase (beta-lactamase superfamily II)